jgi:hypothetical protein
MSIPVPRGCSPVAREPFYHGRDCDPFSRLRATQVPDPARGNTPFQRLLSGARVRKVQSGQGVSRGSIIGLAIG